MKTTRCKCCGMPMPIPETGDYTALPTPTRCRICSHIARQAVRASTRRVDAMRKETIMLGFNRGL